MAENQDKEQISKEVRREKKMQMLYSQRNKVRITSDFSSDTKQAR